MCIGGQIQIVPARLVCQKARRTNFLEDTAAIIPPKAMVSRAIQKVRLLYSPVSDIPAGTFLDTAPSLASFFIGYDS